MTFKEIRDNVKTRLDEDGVFRSNSEIDQAIDEAQKVLCILTGCFSRFSSIDIFNGKAIYSFPYDFFLPLRLSIDNQRIWPTTLRSISRYNHSWFDDTGTPVYYFMLSGLGETGNCPQGRLGANQFWLYPRPNQDKILHIDYVYFPHNLHEDLEPEIPEAFHKLYEDYACYLCLLKEKGSDYVEKALYIFEDFMGKITLLRDLISKQYQGADFSFLPFEWRKIKTV